MSEALFLEARTPRHRSANAINSLGSMRVGEAIYLVALFVYFIQAFLDTTMMPYAMPGEVIPLLKGFAFALVAVKLVLDGFSFSIKRALAVLLALSAGFSAMWIGGYAVPLQFLIMVAGAADVDFDRIAKLYLWSSMVMTLATVAASLAGVIENVSVPRAGGTVYAYGFYYSTEFSAHALSISIAWLYVHRERLSAKVCLPVLLWSAMVFALTDGRLSFFLTVLTVLAVAVVDKRAKKREATNSYPKLLKLSYFFMAAISIALMIAYQGGGLLGTLNKVLTNRLYYAHEGYLNYGITLFGQQIQMTGWGGGRTVWAENYFYIDNSYVNILLRFGLVLLIAVLVVCSLPYSRLRNNCGVVAILIAAVAMASFVNEHLMGLSYNLFALMAFATSTDFTSRQGMADCAPKPANVELGAKDVD